MYNSNVDETIKSNSYLNELNDKFNTISSKYNIVSTKLPLLLNNNSISYNDLLDLEIAMIEFSVQLQSVIFKVENAENAENAESDRLESDRLESDNKKIDSLVDNTLCNMMPLFLLCLMIADKDSILNSNGFGESIINKINKKNKAKLDETNKIEKIEKKDEIVYCMPDIELD